MLLTTTKPASFDFWKIGTIAAAVLAPLLIYFATARSIVHIWDSSETFAHGYVILPISVWLIWKRWDTLPLNQAKPYWPALLLLAACGCGWLLANLAAVQVVQQYAMVAMIPVVALALLGPTLARAMAFPLLFLLLAVPFGEVFIGPLINFTADFTVAALRATGIPVLRIGNHFDIPSGSWSVLEACSGIRYLISSVTLGFLYAYLTYRSRWRQAVFMLVAIIVPIIANGLRAYMIVMIGHLSGMKLAVGVDHIIYGWLFFGLVMFVMLWIGSFWREDENMVAATPISIQRTAAEEHAPVSAARMILVAFSALVCLAAWPIYGSYMDKAVFNPKVVTLAGFTSDWQAARPFTDWKPHFLPGQAQLHRFLQRDGRVVGISVLYYRNQDAGTKLISSSNRLMPEKSPVWIKADTVNRQEAFAGQSLPLRETQLRDAAGSFLVWNWYWVDGKFIASDYLAKLLQAKQKLLMRGDDGASIMVFAPYAKSPEEARTAIRQFLIDNLAPLNATLTGNEKP
jgi:exosortase A